MSLAERGFYRELLDHCHTEGSIPDDPVLLARMCAVSVKEAKRLLPKVRAQFVKEGDRLVNPKASEVREKLFGYHERQQKSGTAGARKRWEKARKDQTNISADSRQNPGSFPVESPQNPRDVHRREGESGVCGDPIATESTKDNSDAMASPSGSLWRADSLPQPQPQPQQPPIVPRGGRAQKVIVIDSERRRWFDEKFWPIVWAKIGVDAARKAWMRKVTDQQTCALIIQAAIKQGPAILERGRRPGNSVLYPTTWLNQGRYLDEDMSANHGSTLKNGADDYPEFKS